MYDFESRKRIPRCLSAPYKISYRRDEIQRTEDDIFISQILLEVTDIEKKLGKKIKEDRGAKYALYILEIIEDARIFIKETLANAIDTVR